MEPIITTIPMLPQQSINEAVEVPHKLQKQPKSTLCIRVLRKKFVCVIIFLFLLYNIMSLFTLIVKKTDDQLFERIMNHTFYNYLAKHKENITVV